MVAPMTEQEVRAFLAHGTRTGKLAWAGPSGQPHVTPVWFVVDDAATDAVEVVFNTGAGSAKGKAILRDPRVAVLVDDERPPFAYVNLTGTVTVSEDLDELRLWATRIGGRYMGAERAEEFGARNGVAGELLVRLRPAKVDGLRDIAD